MEKAHSPTSRYFLPVLGGIFLIFYLCGTYFPSLWWTTHWLAFYPDFVKISLLLVAGCLLLSSYIYPKGISIPTFPKKNIPWIPIGLALIAAALMYAFPMAQDYYGDAYKYAEDLDKNISSIPTGTHEALFTFGLSPWAGHNTVLSVVTYLAYFADITYRESFVILGALCGGLFVWIWLSFLRWYFEETSKQILLGIAGLTAPCMLIFFGHYESYAPVFVAFLWLMTTMIKQGDSPTGSRFWAIVGILLLAIKLHPVALLFIPAILILGLRTFLPQNTLTQRLSNWKGISLIMLIPIFVIGAVLYFFVFEDHVDERSLDSTAMEFDRLFLPLFSPKPPLDTYNLLSFNHIFDYFNEILLWSPIALLLIVVSVVFGRNKISWNATSLLTSGLSLVLFGAFFFMLNPLLSMQIDWDLMAIPAVPFMVFAAVLVKEAKQAIPIHRITPMTLGIALLCVPAFQLHTQTDLIAARTEQLGIRIYHSYYEWSSTVIERGLQMRTSNSRTSYSKRKDLIIKQLEPYAQPGIDFEYSRLFLNEGQYYLRVTKNLTDASDYIEKGYSYYPRGDKANLYMMELHFLKGDYKKAYDFSQTLIQLRYPSHKKALSIAVHCATEAGMYKEALEASTQYVQLPGADSTSLNVHTYLLEGDTARLKAIFK